jgi:hypothetical protein
MVASGGPVEVFVQAKLLGVEANWVMELMPPWQPSENPPCWEMARPTKIET